MKQTILALALLAAAPAFAQTYVSAQVGSATQEVSVSSVSVKDSDTAVSLAAGYKVTPNLAVEAGYLHLGEFSKSDSGYTIYAKPNTGYLALVGSVNVTPAAAIYAKAGLGHTATTVGYHYGSEADSTDVSKNHAVLALGASYAFTPNLAVVAEYTYLGTIAEDKPTEESLKASMFSAGVRFTF